MDNFELRLSNILGIIGNEGESGFDDSAIEELELVLHGCQEQQGKDDYVNQVADSIYDTLWDMLKKVKPDSGLLSDIWEDEGEVSDYTELLIQHPMMSIETAKSYDCDAINRFIDQAPEEVGYFASFKINGHGIRVVYKNGWLVSATSRARASAGRDLTEHLRVILGDFNESLEEFGQVELRGELCLKICNLERAREFNPAIKSPFSAVASLIRPSSTEEELKLLDFLAYGFITEGFEFDTREEEFQQIQESGYNTPDYMVIESATKDELLDVIKSTVESLEEQYEDFGFYCDGVVFEVDDRQIFANMGVSGNHNNGNIAMKVGVWKQDQYSGYVQKIIWKKGKSKLSPVALVASEPNLIEEDESGKILNNDELGVITAQGNRVRNVPLYEPKNILMLGAYVGDVVYFRYGGEAGVVPCFSDGRTLREDAALNIFNGDD